jgi:hypothetical protein
MKKVGFAWLQEKLNISGFQLTHESYIGTTDKSEISSTGTVIRTFKSKYDVKYDNTMSHLEFARIRESLGTCMSLQEADQSMLL